MEGIRGTGGEGRGGGGIKWTCGTYINNHSTCKQVNLRTRQIISRKNSGNWELPRSYLRLWAFTKALPSSPMRGWGFIAGSWTTVLLCLLLLLRLRRQLLLLSIFSWIMVLCLRCLSAETDKDKIWNVASHQFLVLFDHSFEDRVNADGP